MESQNAQVSKSAALKSVGLVERGVCGLFEEAKKNISWCKYQNIRPMWRLSKAARP